MTDQEPKMVLPTPESPSKADMPTKIFGWAISYLVVLIAILAVYVCWPWLRHAVPSTLGPLPVGIVWFGATGAVIASLRGIFFYNKNWNSSYDYWHYSRPVFGMVTGSIGALLYWVSLRLGNSGPVTVRTSGDNWHF